jgi:hypothetical protein
MVALEEKSMVYRVLFLAFACCISLSACAPSVQVMDEGRFVTMARRMPQELQARGLLDSSRSYQPAPFDANIPYGKILFARLSPAFISDIALVPPAMDFTLMAAGGRVQKDNKGFVIQSRPYRITTKMIANVDWEGKGNHAWLISCFVEPRNGRSYEYYLVVPQPLPRKGLVTGKVVAVSECFGSSCTTFVRDRFTAVSAPAADPQAPKTEVIETIPGLNDVTKPPRPQTQSKELQEKSL